MNFVRAVLSTGYSQDPPICDVIWHHFIAALFFPAALLNLLRDLDKAKDIDFMIDYVLIMLRSSMSLNTS